MKSISTTTKGGRNQKNMVPEQMYIELSKCLYYWYLNVREGLYKPGARP